MTLDGEGDEADGPTGRPTGRRQAGKEIEKVCECVCCGVEAREKRYRGVSIGFSKDANGMLFLWLACKKNIDITNLK